MQSILKILLFLAAIFLSNQTVLPQQPPQKTNKTAGNDTALGEVELVRGKIREAMDGKYAITGRRDQVLGKINLLLDEVRGVKEKRIGAKLEAVASYRQYYNTLLKCNGMQNESVPQLLLLQPNSSCLELPPSQHLSQLHLNKSQLSTLSSLSTLSKSRLQTQTKFFNDTSQLLDIHVDLLFYMKSKQANKKTAAIYTSLYNVFNVKRVNVARMYRDENIVMLGMQDEWDKQEQERVEAEKEIGVLEQQLKTLRDQCRANVTRDRGNVDSKLAAVAEAEGKIKKNEIQIANLFKQLEGILKQCKQQTALLKTLAQQYAKLSPSPPPPETP